LIFEFGYQGSKNLIKFYKFNIKAFNWNSCYQAFNLMLPSRQVASRSTYSTYKLLCKAVMVLKTKIWCTFCTFYKLFFGLDKIRKAMKEEFLDIKIIFWELIISGKSLRWIIYTVSFKVSESIFFFSLNALLIRILSLNCTSLWFWVDNL